MIDIHTHILPMVDDGANSVQEAINMLEEAVKKGTRALVLTPHMSIRYPHSKTKLNHLIHDLQTIAQRQHLPIQLMSGCEYCFTSIENYKKDKPQLLTLNHTAYLLIEFPFQVSKANMIQALTLVQHDGFLPVLAHPERYECIQIDPNLALSFSQQGILLQLNKGSLFNHHGTFAKECAHRLCKAHAYTFIGSDAHHLHQRTTDLSECYNYVGYHYGSRYAQALFIENAKRLILKGGHHETNK